MTRLTAWTAAFAAGLAAGAWHRGQQPMPPHVYISSDVPPGLTLRAWQRERRPAMRVSSLRRLWRRLARK